MKKMLSAALAAVMCLSLAACSSGKQDSSKSSASDADSTSTGSQSAVLESDLDYVKDKGTLVVGITEFEPMDYQDASGNWVGFDADLATAFAESLGVNVEFQIIDWDSKVMELNGKTIDVVWNGMTLTEDVQAAMECSQPYLVNQQIVVVPAAVADQYQTEESLADLNFAVEIGSAGCEIAAANGYNYTEVSDQATALLEVASGTADAAIIDSLMAGAMIGENTSYADLTTTVPLTSEEYGVGFRQGSDLAAALDEFLTAKYADGSIQILAETYGVQNALVK
jgi:polar amino acid transport system substrate-binding protein